MSFKADDEISNLLAFFRKGFEAGKAMQMKSSKWRDCFKKKDKDVIEQEKLFQENAVVPVNAKMMCVEAGVVQDLMELYPKTAMRLKWLTLKRREQLIERYNHKLKIKTWVPLQIEFKKPTETAESLDCMFEKFKKRNSEDFPLDPIG